MRERKRKMILKSFKDERKRERNTTMYFNHVLGERERERRERERKGWRRRERGGGGGGGRGRQRRRKRERRRKRDKEEEREGRRERVRKEGYKEGGRECQRYVTKKRENVLC
jgi:hypothetical protein